MPNIKPPSQPSHYPPPEEAKAIYMASAYTVWNEFCAAMGWHDRVTRSKYPVATWSLEKRRAIAKDHMEEISERVFDHRIQYRKDVLATLREFPATADAIHSLIRHKVNSINEALSKNPYATRKIITRGKEFDVPLLDTDELMKLAIAMKTITESKHKSLLLSEVVVKVAEQAPATVEVESGEGSAQEAQGFSIEVIGMGTVSIKDLQRLQAEYIDKPEAILPELSAPAQPAAPEDPLEALIKGDPVYVESSS